MIGFFNLSVILTYVSLVLAVTGINATINGNNTLAIILLAISGFCDMFDGRIARATKRTQDEKSFGIQIDSLNDLVCFGVFPVTIAYNLGVNDVFGIIAGSFYVLCALIRLAYFNVIEEKQQQNDKTNRYYHGLPVTNISVIFPALCILKNIFGTMFPIFLGAFLVIIGVLYILDIKIPKPQGTLFYIMAIFFAICIILFLILAISGNLIL